MSMYVYIKSSIYCGLPQVRVCIDCALCFPGIGFFFSMIAEVQGHTVPLLCTRVVKS